MTARQAAAYAYKSGFCGTGHHFDCRRYYGPAECACFCHTAPPAATTAPPVCGECGRPLDDGAARLAELADLIPPHPLDDP